MFKQYDMLQTKYPTQLKLAKDHSTSKNTLNSLSKFKDFQLIVAIVENPNSSNRLRKKVLHLENGDSFYYNTCAIAQNAALHLAAKTLSVKILNFLLRNKCYDERKKVILSNPNLPEITLLRIMNSETNSDIIEFAQNSLAKRKGLESFK